MTFAYTTAQLLSLAPAAISRPIPRPARKILFRLRIWRPRKGRIRLKHSLSAVDGSHKNSTKTILGLLNARSVVNKAALHDTIVDNGIDILALTETWISSDASNAVRLAPPGFSVAHYHRPDRRGGGLSVVYRATFRHSALDFGIFTTFKLLVTKLVCPESAIILAVLYRPPGPAVDSFFEKLETLINYVHLSSSSFIICGDFNCPGSERLSSLLEKNNLSQHVSFPTHRCGNTLDLIITSTSFSDSIKDERSSDVTYSDHKIILVDICTFSIPPLVETRTYRSIHCINLNRFQSDLMAVVDSLLSASLDLDMLASALDRNLHSLLNRHAPLKTITIRRGQKHIFTLSDEARQSKVSKNAAKNAILKSRADCISSEFGKLNSNPRFLWRLANKVLHSHPVHC
ncbi:hypothetical protein HELRODRAFT_179125 [Helobdella robusta]|uniref:Endonuclease/exonuclease/phosphatase domain-containing protein n=1 Tax=Helobdella robusta TaxID=6412 RepID=T1FE73_HELRO|nr:hypothetical protein HELRODRAFT_179125 [Helobdella robusta]ESN95655.1 hypothetical protein HELRODRAFT_179125 [Helobdella robusta]